MRHEQERARMMSLREVQSLLGCGRTKAYELVQTGEIPSYRIGRLVRVRRGDVEEFLERNRNGTRWWHR